MKALTLCLLLVGLVGCAESGSSAPEVMDTYTPPPATPSSSIRVSNATCTGRWTSRVCVGKVMIINECGYEFALGGDLTVISKDNVVIDTVENGEREIDGCLVNIVNLKAEN